MKGIGTKSNIKGRVIIPSSKSESHRLLILAALSNKQTKIYGNIFGDDVDATISCLEQLGAKFLRQDNAILITPITRDITEATMYARSSGSTLRFMICVCAALGIKLHIDGSPRLRERPITDLVEVLEKQGLTFTSKTLPLTMEGGIKGNSIDIAANISSQYVTGLMLASFGAQKKMQINVVGEIVSKDYIILTAEIMKGFGVKVQNTAQTWTIYPTYETVNEIIVGADWSNAAFFLVLGAINGEIIVSGLDPESHQGDRQIIKILLDAGVNVNLVNGEYIVKRSNICPLDVDARNIPDLVPILSILFANANGISHISGVERLIVKETNRLDEIMKMLSSFGIKTETDGKTLTIYGEKLKNSVDMILPDDHRMAMSTIVGASIVDGESKLEGLECINKSYPNFIEDFKSVGGNINVLSV